MKTLGYVDRGDGNRRLKVFSVTYDRPMKYTQWDRIKDAWEEIRGLGNIDIYYIRGSHYRKIATRFL